MRGGFIWDDDYYVTNNALLRNWESLQRIWFDVLPRPAESKKTLDNLLAAPAVVHATRRLIVVELVPAGTRRERAAFAELLRPLNARRLSLPGDPGDPARRPLRFKLQPEGDETD